MGGMLVPSFFRCETLPSLLSQPLRVAYILVAILAHTPEVALFFSITVNVVDVQRQVWEFLHMLLVMYQLSPSKLSTLLADLALVAIQLVSHIAR